MDFEQVLNSESSEKKVMSTFGIVCITAAGLGAVTLKAICFPFAAPAFRRICLPYVPATTQQVNNVLEALRGRSGKLVDLGSGDGRIVFSAAKQGFHSTGIELNHWLVWYSKLKALKLGLSHKTIFHRSDLWKFNLRPYNNVVIFGVEEMMEELEKKCLHELEKDACIVACRFPLPSSIPIKTIGVGIDRVWIYKC